MSDNLIEALDSLMFAVADLHNRVQRKSPDRTDADSFSDREINKFIDRAANAITRLQSERRQ